MRTPTILTVAIGAVLVAALAAPATALAAPSPKMKGNGAATQSLQTSPTAGAVRANARKQKVLERQIARTLAQRKRKFDAAQARLNKRIAALTVMIDKAAAKGVDVTAARAALEVAKTKLATAAAEEAKAVDLFKAVPTATDRKAAFAAARKQARVAQRSLQMARVQVAKAMQVLRKAIRTASTVPTP
jgi:hypothetical protein